ncbi:MAG: DMT family transporter [candidate division Zixibacteria bacterium]|nr:DMT family transporter [candidate division Zixibacteria bacterium]
MNTIPQQSELRALGALFFGATCVSFAAIFVKLIEPLGMGPTAIGFWRTMLGAVILFAATAATRQRILMPWSVMRWTIAAGFLFFLDLYFWHKSILYCGAGMATILANTQVLATAVLGFFVFKERLGRRFAIAVLSAIGGVVLLIGIGSDVEFSSIYIRGVVLGLLTGVAYAHYLIVLKLAGHAREEVVRRSTGQKGRVNYTAMIAWTSLFSALFLGIAAGVDANETMLPPGPRSFLYVAGLALVVQALGWWTISRSLPRVAASRGGLALLLQPVLATVWGYMFFGERLGLLQIVGAVVTLTAIYIGSVSQKRAAVLPTEKG